jgi:HSP20 family molecular chaperone IbpA
MFRLLLLVVALLGLPARGTAGEASLALAQPPPELPVFVSETGDEVLLRIPVDVAVDPDTVEVQLAGRAVSVTARERDGGREVHSRPITLDGHAVESGASARYEGGWLTVAIQKRKSAQQ